MSPSWCVSKNKLLPIAILCPNRTDSFFLLIFLFAFYNIHCNASQLWHFVLMVSKTFCFEISRLGVFIQIYLTVGMINDCKAKMYKAWMASSNSSLHIVRVVTYGTYFCWDVRMSIFWALVKPNTILNISIYAAKAVSHLSCKWG